MTKNNIPWALPPTPRLEAVDPLTMTTGELLGYVADLQSESRWLRRLLHESLAMVARQQDELTRAARLVDYQRQQLRDRREDAA